MGYQPKIINKFGVLTGWNSITVNLFGRDLEGITEIEYSDEQTIEKASGAGAYPQGEEEGNYAAKASLTLFSEEVNALLEIMPPDPVLGKRLQSIPPFDIPVLYENNGKVVKDVIRNCRIKTVGKAVKQGDGKITIKLELKASHIMWHFI